MNFSSFQSLANQGRALRATLWAANGHSAVVQILPAFKGPHAAYLFEEGCKPRQFRSFDQAANYWTFQCQGIAMLSDVELAL